MQPTEKKRKKNTEKSISIDVKSTYEVLSIAKNQSSCCWMLRWQLEHRMWVWVSEFEHEGTTAVVVGQRIARNISTWQRKVNVEKWKHVCLASTMTCEKKKLNAYSTRKFSYLFPIINLNGWMTICLLWKGCKFVFRILIIIIFVLFSLPSR